MFTLDNNRTPRRGDIYYAEVPYSNGLGSKVRPVVIVSNDSNNYAASDVSVVPVTSSCRRMDIASNVPLPCVGTLSAFSTAKCQDLTVISKAALKQRTGALPDEDMARVEKGIRCALGLSVDPVPVDTSRELKAYRTVLRDLLKAQ